MVILNKKNVYLKALITRRKKTEYNIGHNKEEKLASECVKQNNHYIRQPYFHIYDTLYTMRLSESLKRSKYSIFYKIKHISYAALYPAKIFLILSVFFRFSMF